MKSVSFIIPLYKGKKYIDEQVKNLSKMRYDYEIVFVEDGSHDGAAEYCRATYPQENIRMIEQTNGGIASARSTGIARAENEYMVFVDQDDRVDVDTVRLAVDDMERDDLDALFWTTKRALPGGAIADCDTVFENGKMTSEEKEEAVRTTLLRTPCKYISYFGHIWSGIYRKESILKNGISFKRFIDYEDDWIFVFDCLNKLNGIGFRKETGYYWTSNPHSYSFLRKPVDHYTDRGDQLIAYFIQEASITETKDYAVISFLKQFVLSNSIRNLCSTTQTDTHEYYQVKAYIRSNRQYFLKTSRYMNDLREKLTLTLAIHGMLKCAVMLVRGYVTFKTKAIKEKY